MPNGNILVPADAKNVAKIFEIKPEGKTGGKIVWTCTLPDSLASINGTYINSVSYNPANDMILIDLQEEARKLVVIDHSVPGGNVVFTFEVGGKGRVHAASWVTKYHLGTNTIMPDADSAAMRWNNLLVVYNGMEWVIEVNMTTNKVVKILSYPFAAHEGSVQRLPNGNTLVTQGKTKTITELADDGTPVDTMTAPASINRAYRYGYSYAGVSRLPSSVSQASKIKATTEKLFTYNSSTDCGRINIMNPAGSQIRVSIFSLGGKAVKSFTLSGLTPIFSTNDLVPGVYHVRVRHASGSLVTTFVKNR